MRFLFFSKFLYFSVAMLAFLILVISCTHAKLITPDNFQSIAIGVEISKVEEIYGEPFDVNELQNGTEEWRYIQRFDLNADVTEQIEYVFIIRNGCIIDKQRREKRSNFNRQIQ